MLLLSTADPGGPTVSGLDTFVERRAALLAPAHYRIGLLRWLAAMSLAGAGDAR